MICIFFQKFPIPFLGVPFQGFNFRKYFFIGFLCYNRKRQLKFYDFGVGLCFGCAGWFSQERYCYILRFSNTFYSHMNSLLNGRNLRYYFEMDRLQKDQFSRNRTKMDRFGKRPVPRIERLTKGGFCSNSYKTKFHWSWWQISEKKNKKISV